MCVFHQTENCCNLSHVQSFFNRDILSTVQSRCSAAFNGYHYFSSWVKSTVQSASTFPQPLLIFTSHIIIQFVTYALPPMSFGLLNEFTAFSFSLYSYLSMYSYGNSSYVPPVSQAFYSFGFSEATVTLFFFPVCHSVFVCLITLNSALSTFVCTLIS